LAKVIWNKGTKPDPYVSKTLGIAQWELRAAIHKIKAKAGLGPADNVIM
jgi:hypothetical protein